MLTFPFLCFTDKKEKKLLKKLPKKIKKKLPKTEKLLKVEKVTQQITQNCIINGHTTHK